MLERRDVASWLEGPGVRRDQAADGHRRERLGLPAEGPGRMAGVGPRLVAFLLDTLACAGIAWLVGRDPIWTTPIFAIEALVLTALFGGSAGQLARGLRVTRPHGSAVGWWRATVRTALLVLFIPALIWDRDGRGLHDRLADSVIVHAT